MEFAAGLLLLALTACPEPPEAAEGEAAWSELVEGSRDRGVEGSAGKLNSKLSREAGARDSGDGATARMPDAGAVVVATDCFWGVNFSSSRGFGELAAFGATLLAMTAGLYGGNHCHAAIPAVSANPITSNGMVKLRLGCCTARTMS